MYWVIIKNEASVNFGVQHLTAHLADLGINETNKYQGDGYFKLYITSSQTTSAYARVNLV